MPLAFFSTLRLAGLNASFVLVAAVGAVCLLLFFGRCLWAVIAATLIIGVLILTKILKLIYGPPKRLNEEQQIAAERLGKAVGNALHNAVSLADLRRHRKRSYRWRG